MGTNEWNKYYFTTTLQRAKTYLKIIKKLEFDIHGEISSEFIYTWLVSNAEKMQKELNHRGYGIIKTERLDFNFTKLQLIVYFEEFLSEKIELDFIFQDLPYLIYNCKKVKDLIKPLKNLLFYLKNNLFAYIQDIRETMNYYYNENDELSLNYYS
ncbi:MAG TPA: hypothetical protein ENI29_18940 [bacterium]|nr:hypothetical protein [bacterium]